VNGETDTYYLQSTSNDKYVCWKPGQYFLRVREETDGYQRIPIKFTQVTTSIDTYYTISDGLPDHD